MQATNTIVSHGGTFHADDVFGTAILSRLFPGHEIVRTRDPELVRNAAFAVDVGGEWDACRGRFDHHQRGFEGARPVLDSDGRLIEGKKGVAYASAGLVWAQFGADYIASRLQTLPSDRESEQRILSIWRAIDSAVVQHIDLEDTGVSKSAEGLFGLSAQIGQMNTTWLEEQGLDKEALQDLQMLRFRDAMDHMVMLVDRIIQKKFAQQEAEAIVRGSERLLDGRVLHLAHGGMPWTKVVLEEMPDVLYVLYSESPDGNSMIKCVPEEYGSFKCKKPLPAEWAGLRDRELSAVNGIQDSVFCHTNLFIGAAQSFEGALEMAKLAVADSVS